MLIIDHLENSNNHSNEETIWIYLFLSVMILGFILSYYSITCSIKEVKDSQKYKDFVKKKTGLKTGFEFGGSKMNIPTRPSSGKNKIIHSSKFTV
jgi:hypothetical protein